MVIVLSTVNAEKLLACKRPSSYQIHVIKLFNPGLPEQSKTIRGLLGRLAAGHSPGQREQAPLSDRGTSPARRGTTGGHPLPGEESAPRFHSSISCSLSLL